ncbi:hypothetical protein GALL_503530 [mine drainage metagenome]|uniref:Chaperone modulatory protein CbpM n=1 Tax=mine drainage metagenome TaxID=410659 RepID=A0A1J5PKG7_9ZZZZ
MTTLYSEDETLTVVTRLTRVRLTRYLEANVVAPARSDSGERVFVDSDIARLRLLCDLDEAFGLDEDALGAMMSLLDQLLSARADLRALSAALAAEPEDVRRRIGSVLTREKG